MKHLFIIFCISIGLIGFILMNSYQSVDYKTQAEFDYRYQN